MALEDRHVTATPEGVSLETVLAGLGSRIGAFLVDLAIQLAVFVVLLVALGFAEGRHPSETTRLVIAGAVGLALLATLFGYFVVLELATGGRSVGKRALGLRVVRGDGAPLGFWPILIRNVLRLVDWLPSAYLLASILILATARNQRLGDLAAGTIVVRERTAALQHLQQVPWTDPRQWTGLSRQGWPGPGPAAGTGPSPAVPVLPPALANWDVSGIGSREMQLVRRFLTNRWGYTPDARNRLAWQLAGDLWPLVAGAPSGLHPEQFLEAVVIVKQARG